MKDEDAKKLKAGDWVNVNVDNNDFLIQRINSTDCFIKKFKVAAIIVTNSLIFPLIIIDDSKIFGSYLSLFKHYKLLDSYNGNLISIPDSNNGIKISYWAIDSEDIISIETSISQTNINQIDIPTFCSTCGDKNDYGVLNQPDHTFKCWSCRKDPFRMSF